MRIIRFLDDDHRVHWGIPEGASARLLAGDPCVTRPEPTDRLVAIRRTLAPVDPVNVFCIGKNYADHVAETATEIPEHPVVFMKPTTAVVGPDEAIRIPAVCRDVPQVDFEGELAVVIGHAARDVADEEALGYVRGYTCANDVSARWWQRHGGGQWIRGKGFDSFCPVGPWLVTADEIPDPQLLEIETRVNNVVMQRAATSQMLFPVSRLISFLSQGTTLLPGTVILTGTPAGVGFARNPPVFLTAGDVVVVAISGIGRLESRVEIH